MCKMGRMSMGFSMSIQHGLPGCGSPIRSELRDHDTDFIDSAVRLAASVITAFSTRLNLIRATQTLLMLGTAA